METWAAVRMLGARKSEKVISEAVSQPWVQRLAVVGRIGNHIANTDQISDFVHTFI